MTLMRFSRGLRGCEIIAAISASCSRACTGAGAIDLKQSLLIEQQHAEGFIAEGICPGVEVAENRGLPWIVHAGQAWRNAGIMVRFSPSSAARRIDALIDRYRRHRRGM